MPASASPTPPPEAGSPPLLSLCLIARDEAAMIGQCLASVAGVVDECVVCDTGSTDATVEIAEAAGARVVHFPWTDDFAAARNHALAHATGRWILLLDADERLLPGCQDTLRQAIFHDSFDCGLLPLHHADGLDADPHDVVRGLRRHEEATSLARLFRNTPDLRWEGIIHESPGRWLAAPGRRLEGVPVPIVHYGNIPDIRRSRAKAERNLRLLERHCALHPLDAPRQTYLARERLRAGDSDGARRAAEQGWALAVAAMEKSGTPAPAAPFSATVAGFLRLSAGDSSGCRALVADAWKHGLHHPNLAVLEASALLNLDARPEDLRAAAHQLETVLDRPGAVYVVELLPGATGFTAQRLLGQLYMRLNDPARALVALQAAHAAAPSDPHARLALAELHIDQNTPARALSLVEPLLSEGHPDAWLVAAEAAIAAGQRGQAEALLQQATTTQTAFLHDSRRTRLARLQVEQAAYHRLCTLTGGRPPARAPHPEAARKMASEALQAGQLGRAMQLLPTVLSAQPGDVTAWCLLATACLRQGGRPLAVDLSKTARRLSSHHPAVLALLEALGVDAAEGIGARR